MTSGHVNRTDRLSHGIVEPFDHLHSTAKKFFIAKALFCPSDQSSVQTDTFCSPKLAVFEVCIVNNLGNSTNSLITNCKLFAERLECTVLSSMTKAFGGLEHVKWYC